MLDPQSRYKLRAINDLSDAPSGFGMGIGVAGLVLVAFIIFLACLSEATATYFNVQGLIVVLGGTSLSVLMQCSWRDLKDVRNVIGKSRGLTHEDLLKRLHRMISLSRRVKECGILELQEESLQESDRFLKMGLAAVVDGYAYDDIRKILTTEIEVSNAQSGRVIHILESMASFAPAMGLIGTVIGLIEMLSVLQTPSAVGPSMAMALVSTLYGSVLANVILFPLAGRLKHAAQKSEIHKRIALEGLLSISKLENPLVLEQRLESFYHIASGV